MTNTEEHKHLFNSFTFFQKAINWIHELVEITHHKTPSSSYCFSDAFLWTETFYSETPRSANVEQAPLHMIRIDVWFHKNIFLLLSKQLSRITLCLPLCMHMNLHTDIYICVYEDSSWNKTFSSFQTPSILKHVEQQIAYILQCMNSATKSFIADQEQFHITKTCALVQKQSDKKHQTLIMSIQFKSASLCTSTRKTNHSFSSKLSLIHCEVFLVSEMRNGSDTVNSCLMKLTY